MNSEIELVSISDTETESGDESDFFAMEDDSDKDLTFDLIQETQKSLSNLSIKKKKPRDEEEFEIPHLDENEGKSFELIEKLIHEGKLEKLKMEGCKIYLKRFGLRLSGKKDILLERIKEHLEVKNGGGEEKYPISSFVINCKGDACIGDMVMFKQIISKKMDQNGMRTVTGRIVSESYGAEKQQHTFTIEVLWSKGKKPLPPLYPLRIKGRNLYKLKTMRQKWENEQERTKVLQEKHDRGQAARMSREIRIQEREYRKIQRQNRMNDKSQKEQERINLTTNRKPIELLSSASYDIQTGAHNKFASSSAVQTNPEQWGPQIRPGPSNRNANRSARTEVDQVNYFQGPVHRQKASNGYSEQFSRHDGISDRWDPQRDFSRHGISDRWDPQREFSWHSGISDRLDPQRGKTSDEYRGHGSRYDRPVRRELCRYYIQRRCQYGQECKYSHHS